MNRQLYGIGNLVEREKYGIGSKLKKFVRNIIPNEVASVASAAAPFVAPFNPLLAAGMAGLGNFDKTGSISGGLKAAALTYGGGQLARGIGGAGFQTGFNPFDAASLGQSASSFIGVPYSSPIGTATTGLGQFLNPQAARVSQLGPEAANLQSFFETVKVPTSISTSAPGTLDQLKTIFDPTSGVDFGTRAQTAMSLTGDAIKAMYTVPDGKGGREIDKKAVIATLSAIPSYLDAKKKADQIGLSSNEFNEQIYNQEKSMYQSMYQSRLPMESFGIRTTAQMGGIMNGLQQQQEEPIFPRLETLSENLGQAEQTLGQPSNQSNNSPMTSLMMGPQGFAEGGLLSIQLTPVQKMAMGGEIPVRQNQGGVTELDLRAKGGYIPVGIKEKADDVPAMLSKNEFVFTADAVRGAGNGSINKGAQKMYKLMKSLEKKVKKTKVA
jgi:hypothetical protein